MLIPCPRHTPDRYPADFARWAEWERLDADHCRLAGHRRRVEGCRRRIGEYVARRAGRGYFVSVSWGKDSVALADLWLAADPSAKLVYVRMLDNENPDSVLVRDAFLAGRPGANYEEVAYTYRDATPDWYGPDGRPRRWFQVLSDLARRHGAHVTGVRGDESAKRRRRMAAFGPETANSFAPLQGLSTADVFAHLHANRLPVHPVYAMLGGGRWDREFVRTASLGNPEGAGHGRSEWEREYYGDVLNRLAADQLASANATASARVANDRTGHSSNLASPSYPTQTTA